MREQDLANSFNSVVRNEAELKWSAQQTIMEWVLEKSGAGMVRVDYNDMDWWYQFVSGETSNSLPKKTV